MKKIIGIVLVFIFATPLFAQTDWESSPNNWDNSESNWENSSSNWENSPNNWDNSTSKWGNERIIRDEDGNATGYAVPKKDGGVNYFDLSGNREGYQPAKEK